MPGFDNNDRQSEAILGYRAHALQAEVSSYNGFAFPPALSSGVTVVPEYDDSGRTLKYLTIAVSVSFIVTDTTIYAFDTANQSNSSKALGMEAVTKSLITRLSQPCQPLIFSAKGYGDFSVNTPGGIRDVDFGPKPQVIEMEPLGGSQAYRVEWLCVTRVPPCLRDSTGQLIQFNYSTSWGMDPAGFMIRTVEGSAEIPKTRTPNQAGVHSNNFVQFPYTEFQLIKNKILKAFPMSPGFRRQVFYGWRENRKVLTFKIEDTEIRSDSPFLPGISNIDLSQNMQSSLEDGAFLKWRVSYSADIEVVNSKTVGGISEAKKIAWVWIGKFLQEKRKLFEKVVLQNTNTINNPAPVPPNPAVGPLPPLTGNTGVDTMVQMYNLGSSMSELKGYNTGCMIYPVHISITDSIYGNFIGLTVSYVAIITSDLLGQACGLFDKVEIQGLNQDSWVRYAEATNVFTESIHTNEESEVIVDLCHPVSAPASQKKESSTSGSKKKTEPLLSASIPESEKSWEYYDNKFEFMDENFTVIGSRLHDRTEDTTDTVKPTQMEQYAAEMANVPFEVGGTPTPSSGDTADERKQVKAYSPNPPVCYVRMIGKASRFSGRINPPKLIGVGLGIGRDATTGKPMITDAAKGGALAHKYGGSNIRRWVEKTGLMDDKGKQVIRHHCVWNELYVLDRVPTSGQVNTTGIPHRFQQNFD